MIFVLKYAFTTTGESILAVLAAIRHIAVHVNEKQEILVKIAIHNWRESVVLRNVLEKSISNPTA